MLKTLGLRIAFPGLLLVAATALVGMPYFERLYGEWFRNDLDLRAQLVMDSIGDELDRLVREGSRRELRGVLARVTADERLIAVTICDGDGAPLYRTASMPRELACRSGGGARALTAGDAETRRGRMYVSQFDRMLPDGSFYGVFILHDLGFADRRRNSMRAYVVALGVVGGVVIVGLAVLVAWMILRSWGESLIGEIRGMRIFGETRIRSGRGTAMSGPVMAQIRQVLREVEESQRLEIDYRENWTPEALAHVATEQLAGEQVLVVSNREPYVHRHTADGGIEVTVPASGMVTALEPVVRACSGTWIAHGSGDADTDVVDDNDTVRVPPDDPSYGLRRVWLTPEEEQGYYLGFSNEGLWPLCHLAYVRPAFRPEDWRQYQAVNEKFARVVAHEARSSSPLVFIQDFHFAVLPQRIRALIPGATLVLFWHVPWPNVETFGICPWREELLRGMLSCDLLGFHTRQHCQNFLETVDRYVECQIDHEQMTVAIQGHVCQIASYPISIEWPPRWLKRLPDVASCARAVRERHGIGETVRLAVGVERWDFTKGIVERFHALELMLERNPAWRGRVSLLQVAAPTRSTLPAYRAIQEETLAEAARINERYGDRGWRPILLIDRSLEPEPVFELYRAADLCLVNSLHDGMNLVAKEFVAARDDEDGVLVLSSFAGASRELVEALLVNPYDVEQTADAVRAALEMPAAERRERMRLMRRTVQENNVYRWAGRILMDAQRVRQRKRLLGKRSA